MQRRPPVLQGACVRQCAFSSPPTPGAPGSTGSSAPARASAPSFWRLATKALGHEVEFFIRDGHRAFPPASRPEIGLAGVTPRAARRRIETCAPGHIHIATEGPIGLVTRRRRLAKGLPFTASRHTRLPECRSARFAVALSWGCALERWFHGAGAGKDSRPIPCSALGG
jgi:hypothetical protein